MKFKSDHYKILKFITTILIVIAHSSRMYTNKGVVSLANSSLFFEKITDFIYSFHIPLFFAISGMVWGFCVDDLNKYKDSFKFLKKKILRLLVPYLFFGLFYVTPIMVIFHFTNYSYLDYCIDGILMVKNPRHLWYSVVLFEIYVISIIIKPIIQKKRTKVDLFIILVFLVVCVFSYKLPKIFQVKNTVYYLLFFYLGFIFNRYYEKLNLFIRNPFCIVIALIMLLLTYQYSNIVLNIIKAITGSLVLIGMTSYVKKSFLNNKIIIYLNKNGFGIYLFHPMIIYILYYYLGNMNITPVVLCFGITIVSYVASVLMTDIFRKLHLTMLIGE